MVELNSPLAYKTFLYITSSYHGNQAGTTPFDGPVQDCGISSALALEIPQSCTKPSIWTLILFIEVIVIIWR